MSSVNVDVFLSSVRRARADHLDSFSIEELSRTYENASRRDKIRILRRLMYRLPFELAQMAATDPDSLVRAWLARHGQLLDYRPWNENHTRNTERPDLDLESVIKNDSDEFVRACALSNRHIYDPLRADEFKKLITVSSSMERLGLMRNYAIHPPQAADLYDLSKDFGISVDERAALLTALLNNGYFIDHTQYWEYQYHDNKTIWEMALQWPEEHYGLIMQTFERVEVTDDVKKATFAKAPKSLRLAILAGCENSKNHRVVEEAGLVEKDQECRELSYAVVRILDWKTLQALLKAKDRTALFGLARNRNLPRWMLRHVYRGISGFRELHHEYGPDLLLHDLARYISEDPESWASGETLSPGRRSWLIASELLVGLFKLALVASALLLARTSSEIIAVAALVLLYAKLDQGYSSLHSQLASLAIAYHKNMLQVKRKLGISTDEDATNRKIGIDESDEDAEIFAELKKGAEERGLELLIQMIVRGIAVLAALFFIIRVLSQRL